MTYVLSAGELDSVSKLLNATGILNESIASKSADRILPSGDPTKPEGSSSICTGISAKLLRTNSTFTMETLKRNPTTASSINLTPLTSRDSGKFMHPAYGLKEDLPGDVGTRLLLKTTDCHQRTSSLMNPGSSSGLKLGPSIISSDRLASNHLTAISHDRLLTRVDRPQSFSFVSRQDGRVFTAASGLHRHATSRVDEEHEAASNTSELEDLCIDNSSDDSLNGPPHLNGASSMVQYSDAASSSSFCTVPTPKTTLSNSHCRLRTALLTSATRLPTQSSMDRTSISSTVQSNQPPSIPVCRPSSLQLSEGQSPDVITSGAVGFSTRTPPHDVSEVGLQHSILGKEFTHSRNQPRPPSDLSLVNTNVAISCFTSSALARPPSASSYVLRRMSTDSCMNYRSLSSHSKSISQPQSPELHPRRASLPVSPCRLPMKKRKLDWSQLDKDAPLDSPAPPSDCKQPVSAPCSSFDFSFLNVPKLLCAATSSSGCTSSLTPSVLSPHSSSSQHSSSPSPLIIDCSPDYLSTSLSRSNPKTNTNLAPNNMVPSYSCLDRRPHSIPAPLNSPFVPSGDSTMRQLERNVYNSTSNIPLSSSTLNNLFTFNPTSVLSGLSDSKNSVDSSKRPSLLIRSLSSISETVHIPTTSGVVHSNTIPSTNGAEGLLQSEPPYVGSMKTCRSLDPFQSSSNRHNQMNNGHPTPNSSVCLSSTDLSGHSSSPSSKYSILGRALPVLSNGNGVSIPAMEQQYPQASLSETMCSDSQRRTAIDSSTELPQLISHWLETAANNCPRRSNGSPTELCESTPKPSPSSVPSSNSVIDFKTQLVLSPNSEKQDLLSTDAPHNAQIIMMLSPSAVTTRSGASKVTAADVTTVSANSLSSLQPAVSAGSRKSSFPLFLVSASSSAGAAALAAATARATGAHPSSLVPVPVQITYMPSSTVTTSTGPSQQTVGLLNSSSNCDGRSSLEPCEQRLLISLCTTAPSSKRGSDSPSTDHKPPLLFDSPSLIASLDGGLLGSSNLHLGAGSQGAAGIPLSRTAMAHPSA